ncbi:MAG: M66 family metalloprotease [Lysobacter sp.]
MIAHRRSAVVGAVVATACCMAAAGMANWQDQTALAGRAARAFFASAQASDTKALLLVPPSNVRATSGDGSITVAWNGVVAATNYHVFVSTKSGGQPSTPAVSTLLASSATVNNLANGVKYYFTVKASNLLETSNASVEISATPHASASALNIETLEMAQTHAIPAEGRSWTLTNASEQLHQSGSRESFAIAKLSANDVVGVVIEGWNNGAALGAVSMYTPAAFPPTEDNGPAYAADRYTAAIPYQWMKPGLHLRVRSEDHPPGDYKPVDVGSDMYMTLRTLPFYLFGATETNSIPFNQTAEPSYSTVVQIFTHWPFGGVIAENHRARSAVWPSIIVSPGSGKTAYKVSNTDQERVGYDIMSATLKILGALKYANGEQSPSYQYYAPLIMFNAQGQYEGPGGGLGQVGGSIGTGDYTYRGIFIHEQGHAMGLSHQGGAYTDGKYPYYGGSVAGSVWGYDASIGEFRALFVPPSAENFPNCRTDSSGGFPRQFDSEDRCVKQDPMQGGSGDQPNYSRYTMFSDYSTAMMQRFAEGRTTVNTDGTRNYDGGGIVPSSEFPSGYKRWDTIDKKWVGVSTATTKGGIYGLNQNLPIVRDVPVHAIVLTHSYVGPPELTQIYPPLRYTGNLLEAIDPTVPADLAKITPNTGDYYWYCRNGGCDYTVRVTYADGAQRHVLIQGGYRPFNQPSGTPAASASDPTSSKSFNYWAVQVPANKLLRKIELLSTPMVFNGMPANPVVLASRDVPPPALAKSSARCDEIKAVAVPQWLQPKTKCR